MNDRNTGKGVQKFRDNHGLTSQERRVAEYFAKRDDWIEAYCEGYPHARHWKNSSIHSAINKLKKKPGFWDVVHDIRAPVVAQARLTFADILAETEERYYRIRDDELMRAESPIQHGKLTIATLVALGKMHTDAAEAIKHATPRALEGQRLDDLSDDELLQLRDESRVIEASVSGPGEAESGRFRELLRAGPAGEAPSDPMHGAADGDRGPHPPGDGADAPGRGEVDVLERARARLGRREVPGDCPDCGKPHDGACPGLRS